MDKGSPSLNRPTRIVELKSVGSHDCRSQSRATQTGSVPSPVRQRGIIPSTGQGTAYGTILISTMGGAKVGLIERYANAYPEVLADLDDNSRARLVQILGTTADGGLWPEQDVSDLVERVSGRITFVEYLQRGRRARTS